MAVGSHALTTLANVKTWLDISGSSDDALLEAAIDRASAIIATYCDREFVSSTFYEWQMPQGERNLKVDNIPIQEVHTVAFGHSLALSIESETASTDILATVSFDGTSLRLEKRIADGTRSTATITATDQPSTSGLVSFINASVSGWTATLNTNAYTRTLHRFGGRGVLAGPALLHYADDNVAEYEVEFERGIVHIVSDRFPVEASGYNLNRFPRGFYPVFVEYVAGYSTIPDDLEHVAIELSADLYRQRLDDDRMAGEGLGDYNYTRRATEEILGERMSMLDGFRRIR